MTWRRRQNAHSSMLQTTPRGFANTLGGAAALQRNLDRLEEWTEKKFSKDECKFLYLG